MNKDKAVTAQSDGKKGNPETQKEADRKGNATVAEIPGSNKSERTGKARHPKNR